MMYSILMHRCSWPLVPDRRISGTHVTLENDGIPLALYTLLLQGGARSKRQTSGQYKFHSKHMQPYAWKHQMLVN
jgi:hypothetical protein